MKKLRRITSMLMVFALALSLCAFSVSAAEPDMDVSDPLLAAMMDADDFEVSQSEDGSLTIMTASIPTNQLPLRVMRASMTRSGTATAMEDSEFTFGCVYGDGSHCRMVTTNVDDQWNLEVTYAYNNGKDISITDSVKAGMSRITVISDTDGDELDFDIDVTISADRAPSVDWEFEGEQY